jgi:hypothetical protein
MTFQSGLLMNDGATADSNIILSPNGDGIVKVTSQELNVGGKLKFSAAQISTSYNKDLNLSPNGNGKVVTNSTVIASQGIIGGIQFTGTHIQPETTGENFQLSPNGNGVVVIVSAKSEWASVGNLTIDGDTISSSTDANIAFTPASDGHIEIGNKFQVDSLELNANTITVTAANTDLIFSPHGTGRLVTDHTISVGDFTVASNSISSTTGDVHLIPDGTGKVVLSNTLIDNIFMNGNIISTTNTDGNLVFSPDGTGKTVVSKNLKVTGSLLVDDLKVDGNVLSTTVSNGKSFIFCGNEFSSLSYYLYFLLLYVFLH